MSEFKWCGGRSLLQQPTSGGLAAGDLSFYTFSLFSALTTKNAPNNTAINIMPYTTNNSMILFFCD